MKTLTALLGASLIAMTVGLVHARDLGPDEALRLRDAGTIVSFENSMPRPWPGTPEHALAKPSWKRSTASTSTRSSCVTHRGWNGTWSWTP